MTYRSLTPYSISCNNIIRPINSLNNKHPNSKIKIRTQIIINLSKPYLIGGDDLGNLFYTPLNNFQIKRKKIHNDFIRRIHYYELNKGIHVILTCSDDGIINCYELIESNGLKFNFIFDLNYGIGINDFSCFTTPILYENESGEFKIKGNQLNINKEVFKIYLEKNLLIASFFGLRVYNNEYNKKLMKSFPNPIYSISRINETLYAIGSDIGVSIIELNYPNIIITIIKTFEIGTCYKILLIDNKLFCCTNDIYEINITNQNIKNYNLTNLLKEDFLDLTIKREIKSKKNSLEFIDKLFTITENELKKITIKREEFILTNELKLFCLKDSKSIFRCKELNLNEKKLVLNFDKPIELKITDKIFVNNKVYSILGRELINEIPYKTYNSKYEFSIKPLLSHEFENISVFLINNIFYLFFNGELVLFTNCSEYHLLETLDYKYFLIKRDNKNYFLYFKSINKESNKESNIDFNKKTNFLKIEKYFIYFIETKINEFSFISIKQKIGSLNSEFNSLKINEIKNIFNKEIEIKNILNDYLIKNIKINKKLKDTSIIESLISSSKELKDKLTNLLFEVSEDNSSLFYKILKYGTANKTENYLINLNKEKENKKDKKKLRLIFEKYLKEKDYKNSLRISEEIEINENMKNILIILNEKTII